MNKADMCKKFWTERLSYPSFAPKARRFYELAWLMREIEKGSILDLGCGDGTILELLLRTTGLDTFYGYDISENFLSKVDNRIITKRCDVLEEKDFPITDYTLLSSLLIYIPDDKAVTSLLKMIKSDVVFIKNPCTDKDLFISKDSPVGKGYTAYYRTLEHLLNLIGKHYKITRVDRIYPDEIESKFDSKQYFIKAER